MININFDDLTLLEKNVYNTLFEHFKTNDKLSITDAATLCNVSPSKISKLVKKLGFDSYKTFLKFCRNEPLDTNQKYHSNELERINNFINDFDHNVVVNFVNHLNKYNKVILYGLGPSYFCCEYFEYKLRIESNKYVIATNNILQIENLLDDDTLLIIFSVGGKFNNFNDLISIAKDKSSKAIMLFEEFNSNTYDEFVYVFFLSNHRQDSNLLHHRKTRTIFFLFIEEVISRLIDEKNL